MPEETTPTAPAETSNPSSGSETAAPEPSTSTEAEAQPSDAFAGFDFSNMDFADGDETVTVDHTKTESGKPDQPVVQEPPATPSPTGAPVSPTVQTQQPAQPASPTPAPAQQTPPSSAAAGEDPYLKAWNENQVALDTELRNYYAIDDATAERFLENPKEVLPAILARVHMAVLQNTYKTVLDRLPPLMQQTAVVVREHAKSEDKFFKAWPVFNAQDPAHMNTILTYGQMYRQQHPTASEADFTKFVGAAAAAHLGLKMPTKGANGKDRRPLPYNPAAGSAPSIGSGEPKPTQFEDLFNAVKMQE